MDYNKILDIKSNGIPAKKGSILLSDPFTDCDYFKQSAVLITNKTEEGSVGFILNKPLGQNINDIIEDFPDFDAQVFLGGPVEENRLHYIHTLGSSRLPGSLHVFGKIYWGGEINILKQLISAGKASPNDVRFFIGYSGWSPNQLESEIQRHTWLVMNLTTKEIMRQDTSSWRYGMGKMGDRYKPWANAPDNPEHN